MNLLNARTRKFLLTAIALLAVSGVSQYAAAQDTDLRVSRGDAMKAATSKFSPVYPPVAKQLRLEGDVEVEAHISESGSVESVKALTGNAVLVGAALDAMKRWRFTPFTDGGKPVKAVAPILFSFKL